MIYLEEVLAPFWVSRPDLFMHWREGRDPLNGARTSLR